MSIVTNQTTELIGKTPVYQLPNTNIYVKLEKYNVGGSVKDRAVLGMLQDAKEKGCIHEDSIIVEATSGNTGIALAMVGAILHIKTVIIMPESMSKERRELIKAYGAQLILTPKETGMKGALERANEILEKYPSQLSGGEATRVGILLALLSKPKILICDEITSGLDNETKQKIINLLLSLDEKISIIFITHDILSAMKIAQKVLIIESGKQVAWGKFEDLASQNVLKKYLDAAKFYEDKL